MQRTKGAGQALRVSLGGARAAANHARPTRAEVDRAFDPALRIGPLIVKSADTLFTARKKHTRNDAVERERSPKPREIGEAEVDSRYLEQHDSGACVSQRFDQRRGVAGTRELFVSAVFEHRPSR